MLRWLLPAAAPVIAIGTRAQLAAGNPSPTVDPALRFAHGKRRVRCAPAAAEAPVAVGDAALDRRRRRTIVVVHSLSLDVPDQLVPVFPAYEERFLCLVLSLLRSRRSRVVYVTSQPITAAP